MNPNNQTISQQTPSPARPKKSFFRRYWGWFLGGGILLSLVSLLAFIAFPLPYYVEKPGGAYDIGQVMTVNGKANQEEGSYNFVAVSVGQATPLRLLLAKLDPYSQVLPKEEVTGGTSNQEYQLMNQYYMESSQNTAIYQALKLSDKEVNLAFKGVYVLDIADNSTFKDKLEISDTVTGVNGKTFKSSKDLIAYVSGLKLGDQVSVQFTRKDQKKSATGQVIKLKNGKNGIGISLTDHTEVESKDKIDFTTEGVGGPSAGLMFTLSIYDQLNDEDLLKGRTIAGTGTIEQDGSVGDIGGVAQKVVAADQSGADVFFVPNNPVSKEDKSYYPNGNNYQEAKATAKKIGSKMAIVPVTKAQDAIDYLKK